MLRALKYLQVLLEADRQYLSHGGFLELLRSPEILAVQPASQAVAPRQLRPPHCMCRSEPVSEKKLNTINVMCLVVNGVSEISLSVEMLNNSRFCVCFLHCIDGQQWLRLIFCPKSAMAAETAQSFPIRKHVERSGRTLALVLFRMGISNFLVVFNSS